MFKEELEVLINKVWFVVILDKKFIESEKAQINYQWNELMKNVKNGKIDREMISYTMERLNAMDRFLIDQGMRELL